MRKIKPESCVQLEDTWVSRSHYQISPDRVVYLKNIGFPEAVPLFTFSSGLLVSSALFYFKLFCYRALPIFGLWKVHIHKSQLPNVYSDCFPVSLSQHFVFFSPHSPPGIFISMSSLQTSQVDFAPRVPNLCVHTFRRYEMSLEWCPLPSLLTLLPSRF